LFFLAAQAGPLVLQISLFTLAHTITLALAALGYVSIPGEIVEPLIAASIVFVAVENIFTRRVSRWRPYVIFGFGLLHGLGFASVLGEFGLPQETFVAALIGFNVGVEAGQLAVIAVMFLCVWQAIRIDLGANEVAQGFALYAVLFAAAVALIALNPPILVALLENPVWVFAAPLAAIFALSGLSIALRDQIDAYRRIVTIPASAAIAAVGAFWVMERVFL
ncbi:MAG: HupE/UreJ family protein, partial [Proteobacteria bacterium]|nr:HupE/UreJ family protein [Pseudomonadota bacterium]